MVFGGGLFNMVIDAQVLGVSASGRKIYTVCYRVIFECLDPPFHISHAVPVRRKNQHLYQACSDPDPLKNRRFLFEILPLEAPD
jgi:hypothetical protein